MRALLTRWPVPTPRAWIERFHQPETEAELQALRRLVAPSQAFGIAALKTSRNVPYCPLRIVKEKQPGPDSLFSSKTTELR